MNSIIAIKNITIQPKVRDWCKMPYQGHPQGCPKFGKSENCPPRVGMVDQVFDLTRPFWLGIVDFDLKEFALKMKTKHPNWSDKQCRCCLYWQNSVRKKLNSICHEAVLQGKGNFFTLIPEAMGINVFRTCYGVGLKLKRNPERIFKISLIGFARAARVLPGRCGGKGRQNLALRSPMTFEFPEVNTTRTS